MTATITLGIGDGAVDVPVPEQSLVYLAVQASELGIDLDADTTFESLRDIVFAKGYQALEVLAPDLPKHMPEWAFRGYASREAMDTGDLTDKDALRAAPSAPQIKQAFTIGLQVNGLEELLGMIQRWAGPTLLEAAFQARLAEFLSRKSPSSRPANGTSTSTDSGTRAPSSDETAPSASGSSPA